MKKNRSILLILVISLLAGSTYGQINVFGPEQNSVSPDELLSWTLVGKGKAEKHGSQISMQESDDSKGIMLVSPKAYPANIIVRYKVMALTPATVLVALLSVSDVGETVNLSIPDDFDGSLGLFTNERENYFFAFKNAPHNVTPFVKKSPNANNALGSAKKNSMIAGVYYDVEIGKHQKKLWLSVDGEKIFEAEDENPLNGGHLALRIRGTAGFKAGCLIKDLEIFSGDNLAEGTGDAETYARFVPERKDDFAWENDKIAFRAYGPALRESAENSGIDAWLKRVDYPIINKWYKEAEEGKSYHEDHGEGLDNYHVGSSAGCGGTGIWLNGEREPLETFTDYEVIEVTPERSRFRLIYERKINGVLYGEEKTITIELGKRLFQVESIFFIDKQPASNLPVCIGLTTHDGKAEAFFNRSKGWIATWEKLGDSELGTGARMDPAHIDSIVNVDSKAKDESHIFLIAKTDAKGHISYEAGYGWKKAGKITTREAWSNYISNK